MENTLTIFRYESGACGTFGFAVMNGKAVCHTLEPQNRGGGRNCAVAPGTYQLIMEWSPKFGRKLPTIIAPGRSGLRFHYGNFVDDTRGCVLVGTSRGRALLIQSARALGALIELIERRNINKLNVIDYA